MLKSNLLLAIGACAAIAAASAMAHGDSHASPKRFDPRKVEETPFGRAGDPARAQRTIEIAMTDAMRFTPSALTVRRGETVKFVVSNHGKLLHEMVFGTAKDLEKHAQLMRRFPDMAHEDANMVHVKPGQTGEIVWQFTKAGEFSFACLVPGHFEAGMIGTVLVK